MALLSFVDVRPTHQRRLARPKMRKMPKSRFANPQLKEVANKARYCHGWEQKVLVLQVDLFLLLLKGVSFHTRLDPGSRKWVCIYCMYDIYIYIEICIYIYMYTYMYVYAHYIVYIYIYFRHSVFSKWYI